MCAPDGCSGQAVDMKGSERRVAHCVGTARCVLCCCAERSLALALRTHSVKQLPFVALSAWLLACTFLALVRHARGARAFAGRTSTALLLQCAPRT